MKCAVCDQRKAKRSCPAKNSQICAQCCGEKRVLEIDCPENCGYLKAGREREADSYARRFRVVSSADARYNRTVSEYQDALARIEYVIGRERLSTRNLTDNDVVQAIAVLLETYRTEEKGVLYERTSEDLRTESLRKVLRDTIESLRNPDGNDAHGIVDPQSTRLPLEAAIRCLELVRAMAASYLGDRESQSGYVDFLALLFPREEKRSSILMP